MNFLDAAQAVKDGEGKGFRRAIWTKNTFLVIADSAGQQLEFCCGAIYIPYVCDFLADDYELVNPKPQTETVEVKRWMILPLPGVQADNCCRYPYEVKQDWVPDGHVQIELVGAYEAPAKVKVKRREELPRQAVEWGSRCPADINGTVKYYREWEE